MRLPPESGKVPLPQQTENSAPLPMHRPSRMDVRNVMSV